MPAVTKQTLLDRVNKHREARGLNPLTARNFQQAVNIARHNKLMRAAAIDRLAKHGDARSPRPKKQSRRSQG